LTRTACTICGIVFFLLEEVEDGDLELLDARHLGGVDDGAARARAERLLGRLEALGATVLVALHRRRANGDDALDAMGEVGEAQLKHHGPGHAGRLRVVRLRLRGHLVRALARG